ncbi:predicted protein [Verticillium alfalfae VaMs.102]|uniref:Predicted protein n=1 Tax=Verticillium alfalfae (strain VaMs.102 / ATCC MYA-4576 / FGSC 10136) TaxID=526221 RepID=C9SYL9_VERA1|nr:predicted protein [Verticillium alfalfae VaMs.102]EEY23884.1 predicted protein [Verticillium alfalfae VaMs.102]
MLAMSLSAFHFSLSIPLPILLSTSLPISHSHPSLSMLRFLVLSTRYPSTLSFLYSPLSSSANLSTLSMPKASEYKTVMPVGLNRPIRIAQSIQTWRKRYDGPYEDVLKARAAEYFSVEDDLVGDMKLGRKGALSKTWDKKSLKTTKLSIRSDLRNESGQPFDADMVIRIDRVFERLVFSARPPQLSSNAAFRRLRDSDDGEIPLTAYLAAEAAMMVTAGSSHDLGWMKAGGYEIYIRVFLWPKAMKVNRDRIIKMSLEVRPPVGGTTLSNNHFWALAVRWVLSVPSAHHPFQHPVIRSAIAMLRDVIELNNPALDPLGVLSGVYHESRVAQLWAAHCLVMSDKIQWVNACGLKGLSNLDRRRTDEYDWAKWAGSCHRLDIDDETIPVPVCRVLDQFLKVGARYKDRDRTGWNHSVHLLPQHIDKFRFRLPRELKLIRLHMKNDERHQADAIRSEASISYVDAVNDAKERTYRLSHSGLRSSYAALLESSQQNRVSSAEPAHTESQSQAHDDSQVSSVVSAINVPQPAIDPQSGHGNLLGNRKRPAPAEDNVVADEAFDREIKAIKLTVAELSTSLVDQKEAAESTNAKMQTQHTGINDSLGSLKKQATIYAAKLGKVTRINKDMSDKISSHDEQLQQMERHFDKKLDQYEAMQTKDLEDFDRRLNESIAKVNMLEQNNANLTQEVERLKTQLEETTASVEKNHRRSQMEETEDAAEPSPCID